LSANTGTEAAQRNNECELSADRIEARMVRRFWAGELQASSAATAPCCSRSSGPNAHERGQSACV
jgi:hypothetical protein